MKFSDLGVASPIAALLARKGMADAYPIQAGVIPPALAGNDVMGIAQTGSGKTLSFAIPTLMNIAGKANSQNRHIDVLVLVPTRELAIQILEVYKELEPAVATKVTVQAVYGGVSINPQMLDLQHTHILIATPGRLLDLLDKNALSLSAVSTLVMDEADKLLGAGFAEETDRILKLLPEKRQTLLFSATLSSKVEDVQRAILSTPTIVHIAPDEVAVEAIEQIAYMMKSDEKGPMLRRIIWDLEIDRVLIFTASTQKADKVADKLHKNGINARAIHGKKSQGNRNESLQMLKSGKLTALVTTDLLGRGIHIEDLPYVINYELPRSPKDYVHRIGRTGRATKSGRAITLLTQEEEPHFYTIQKKMGKRVQIKNIAEL